MNSLPIASGPIFNDQKQFSAALSVRVEKLVPVQMPVRVSLYARSPHLSERLFQRHGAGFSASQRRFLRGPLLRKFQQLVKERSAARHQTMSARANVL
jgi:hypothetical protein